MPAVRAGGGSSSSPSCISARTSWCRILRGGAGSGCPTIPTRRYFTLAPDWVCEVLSPSTRKLDLHGKRPIYAREGVAHLWLVEPADRTLEAFELHEGRWVLAATAKDADPVCIRPFDAVTFSLGDLWP